MNKPWKVVLLLLGIFVAGGVTGAFVMLRVGREMFIKRPGPEQWAPNHLKRLAERLKLEPEQVEQLRPIVRRNMEELNRLRDTSMAETKFVFERMEREISEKLTPEQRSKFEQLNKEMRERAKRVMPDRKKRPPGPGGPGPEGAPPAGETPPSAGEEPVPAKPPGGG
jgi:uncharacterized membrane protein